MFSLPPLLKLPTIFVTKDSFQLMNIGGAIALEGSNFPFQHRATISSRQVQNPTVPLNAG